MHHLSLWRSHSHRQNRHYHSGSPCCESPWTIHLHGRLQPIFYLTKWGCLLFTHTNTKTAKHKHPSARALVINNYFSKVGIECHTDRCHQDLSLLWQTQKIQTLASTCIANKHFDAQRGTLPFRICFASNLFLTCNAASIIYFLSYSIQGSLNKKPYFTWKRSAQTSQ